MSGKSYPNDVVEQAQVVSNAWTQISPTLAFGALNAAALTTDLTAATSLQAQITGLETQLLDLRNKREAVNLSIWDKLKRVRAGVKSIYGDDSSQYQMVGGTRMSDRKTPTRRASSQPAA
jgi:hypothetical protein